MLAPVNDAFAGQTGQFDVNDYLIAGNLSMAEFLNLREVEVVGGATLAVDPANWSVGGARVTTSSEADNGQVNGDHLVRHAELSPGIALAPPTVRWPARAGA